MTCSLVAQKRLLALEPDIYSSLGRRGGRSGPGWTMREAYLEQLLIRQWQTSQRTIDQLLAVVFHQLAANGLDDWIGDGAGNLESKP